MTNVKVNLRLDFSRHVRLHRPRGWWPVVPRCDHLYTSSRGAAAEGRDNDLLCAGLSQL